MKEVIFRKSEYTTPYRSYMDFYRDIVIKLDAKNNIDFSDTEDLGFNADILDEFMWYNQDENLKLIFIGLDLKRIESQKTYDDYEWKLIIEIMQEFVEKFPNNTLEFRGEE